jgi:predicted transcriptional regulator
MELEILRVLWKRGPATVHEVHLALNANRPVGHTSVLKIMQIMFEKGLVKRDEAQRAHRYEARSSQEQTQRKLLDDLLDRAYEGSAASLVLQALSTKRASPEELREIRELLEQCEEKRK